MLKVRKHKKKNTIVLMQNSIFSTNYDYFPPENTETTGK